MNYFDLNTGLRDVTEQLHNLCIEVAIVKGVHPDYCEVGDE